MHFLPFINIAFILNFNTRSVSLQSRCFSSDIKGQRRNLHFVTLSAHSSEQPHSGEPGAQAVQPYLSLRGLESTTTYACLHFGRYKQTWNKEQNLQCPFQSWLTTAVLGENYSNAVRSSLLLSGQKKIVKHFISKT